MHSIPSPHAAFVLQPDEPPVGPLLIDPPPPAAGSVSTSLPHAISTPTQATTKKRMLAIIKLAWLKPPQSTSRYRSSITRSPSHSATAALSFTVRGISIGSVPIHPKPRSCLGLACSSAGTVTVRSNTSLW